MSPIDELIQNLTHDDFEVQYAADQALRQLGKSAVEPLTDALKKGKGRAAFIADILGFIGDARAIDALCATLNNDDDGLTRYEAAKALGRIGKPSVPCLIEALKHQSPGTRQKVAEVLGELGDARATEPLIVVLQDVGWAAAKALGEIGDPRAEGALLQASRDSDSELSSAARDALVKLRGSALSQTIAGLVDKILTCSADAQVGEVLAFAGEKKSRPMSAYQQMEDAALELHGLQRQMTENDRQYLNERLAELDGDHDWNVRRCAEIIRTGE